MEAMGFVAPWCGLSSLSATEGNANANDTRQFWVHILPPVGKPQSTSVLMGIFFFEDDYLQGKKMDTKWLH